jgi:hypothetical protein
VWDREPTHGPSAARDAYTSGFFSGNRRYAEAFGDEWVILSAKYGLIPPDFTIPEPYNVTFKRPGTDPIEMKVLRQQLIEQHLDAFDVVIGLGGADYRRVIEQAFVGTRVRLAFPFLGMNLFQMMAAAKQAVTSASSQQEVPPRHPRRTGRTLAPRGATPSVAATRKTSIPTSADFERELNALLSAATDAGKSSMHISAAYLHRRVGAYPGPNHRMATCCSVMLGRRGPRDQIVCQPPKGKGASLTICYELGV